MENQDIDYINEKQFSKRFSIPLSTLRNWRFRGQGPPYKKISSRMIRYSLKEVVEWIENHTVEPFN